MPTPCIFIQSLHRGCVEHVAAFYGQERYRQYKCRRLPSFSPSNPIDRTWIGEGFKADNSVDFWLVEMSGIPFGLLSETLTSPLVHVVPRVNVDQASLAVCIEDASSTLQRFT